MLKILHLDVETAPNIAHVWGLWQQNVSISQLQESSYTMCWSAKWQDSKKVLYKKHDASNFLSSLWELLDIADVVVHYNGKKFDIPTVNKEFALEGMPPPSPYKQIDLLKVVRSKFRFPSNKLDYVAQAFGLGKKHEHVGHELWVQCMAEDKEAWKTMERYNKQDVVLLERLYNRLLPWIDNHPNTALYVDSEQPVCTNCGSTHIQSRGFAKTTTQIYRRHQCVTCGTWMRSRTSEIPQERRQTILTQEKL